MFGIFGHGNVHGLGQAVDEYGTALPEAMRVLTSPVEAGAVVLALPQDVQSHAYDFPERLFEERTWRIERPPADARRIGEAAELLRSAQRPLLVAGGGARYSEAEAEVRSEERRVGKECRAR